MYMIRFVSIVVMIVLVIIDSIACFILISISTIVMHLSLAVQPMAGCVAARAAGDARRVLRGRGRGRGRPRGRPRGRGRGDRERGQGEGTGRGDRER